MKVYYYNAMFLILPMATTIVNLVFAFGVSSVHNKVSAEVLATSVEQEATAVPGNCKWEDAEGKSCSNSIEDEEEDPMLLPFPTPDDPNFKAYVRADISSFYQEPVGSRKEKTPAYNGMAGKFINISPNRVTLYWEDERNKGYFMSNVGPWEAGGSATYPGHKWYFANPKDPNDILCRFVTVPGTAIYYYDPYTPKEDDEMMKLQPQSRGVYDVYNDTAAWHSLWTTSSKDQLSSKDKDMHDQHRYNLVFGARYKNFTKGQEWLSMYPRSPPLHKMWRADYFGQEHHIQTKETQFINVPPREKWQDGKQLQQQQQRQLNDDEDKDMQHVMFEEYRNPGIMNITIKALSVAPRAFEIRNFLSDVEVDHVLELVKLKNMPKSSTGDLYDKSSATAQIENVRTSRNTWVSREESPILDAIYRRAADVLRIDEAMLRDRLPNEIKDYGKYNEITQKRSGRIGEELQVVHYDVGEKYTPHHDFGYVDGIPDKPSRSINIAMYLNEGMKGGETSFPRWRSSETKEPLAITPEKGKAVLFYMINPDGNLDDLTQHAGNPVLDGEKWFANLWIWDPYRP